MKIGFSFGRCVRDIVNGTVQYDDVLFIIASTYMEKPEDVRSVTEAYLHRRDYLQGLDAEACLSVANRLWDDRKVLQPRIENIHRSMVPEHAVWGDLFLSPKDTNPSITAAWEQYRMLVDLCGHGQGTVDNGWR
jgi:hypothetical protein